MPSFVCLSVGSGRIVPRESCTRGSQQVLNEPPSSSQSTNFLTPAILMSNSRPITTAPSSSNFQLIFNNALKSYEKRTKNDLRAHPLAVELQDCNSPSKILAILHKQAQGLDQSLSGDDRWTKWLDPTVNVLYRLSETLGEGISLVSLKTCTYLRSAVSRVYSIGIFTWKGDICRSWGSPLSTKLP